MVKKHSLQEFQLQDFLLSQQHKPCQMSLGMPSDKLLEMLETLEMFPMYLEMLSLTVSHLETDLEMVFWMDSDVRTRILIRVALLKKPKWRKQMKMIDLSLRNIGKYMPYGTYVPLDTPSISLYTLVQFWKTQKPFFEPISSESLKILPMCGSKFPRFQWFFRMGKENGQIEEIENGKSEDEIEIESDMPCKVEPTEVETIQEISKVSHSWVI